MVFLSVVPNRSENGIRFNCSKSIGKLWYFFQLIQINRDMMIFLSVVSNQSKNYVPFSCSKSIGKWYSFQFDRKWKPSWLRFLAPPNSTSRQFSSYLLLTHLLYLFSMFYLPRCTRQIFLMVLPWYRCHFILLSSNNNNNWRWSSNHRFYTSFQIDSKMIVVTVFLLIMNQTTFRLVTIWFIYSKEKLSTQSCTFQFRIKIMNIFQRN